ncbi:hypothetical protein KFE25_003218 [Diacronema lutheri]|uniref:Uncharacterized protein n=1 Tax=Diacronema lutheri TaxID=2081491 RepID=A0A8J5XRM8_DIALT|nr:hypothetical protein KFE25_003218 [Diacronema lutheri]
MAELELGEEAVFGEVANADGTLQCARAAELCIRLGVGHPLIEQQLGARVDELLRPLGKSAHSLDSISRAEFGAILCEVRGWLARVARERTGEFATALAPRADGAPSALQGAVASGDPGKVRALLLLGADANQPFADGVLPLYMAAQRGSSGVATVLVRDGGAELDALSKVGATALAVACWKGRAAVAACLLELRASPNAQSRDGSTALYMAAKGGHTDVIRELLRATGHPAYGGGVGGAARTEPLDLERSTARGHTPLLRAAHGGHAAAVALLLEAAADPHATDLDGVSPLCAAAAAGSVDIARALIAARADADQASFRGSAPLLIAVERRHSAMVDVLLDDGAADANVASRAGLCAAWFARRTAQPHVAERLVDAGCRLDARLPDGGHLLAACCQAGEAEDVAWLLQHGVPPDLPTADGLRPLQLAASAREGACDVALVLVRAGAGADPPDEERGRGGPAAVSALCTAAQRGDGELVALLLDAGASVEWRPADGAPSPLWLAALRGHVAVCAALLDARAALDPPPSDRARRPPRGRSAMWAAAAGGHAELIGALGKVALPPDRVPLHARADDDGVEPLALAAALGHGDAVGALLALGARAMAALPSGVPALGAAAHAGALAAMRALLAARASVDDGGSAGLPALLLAAHTGQRDAAMLLLRAQADVHAASPGGQTALGIAHRRGHSALAALLVRHGADPASIHARTAGLVELGAGDARAGGAGDGDDGGESSELARLLPLLPPSVVALAAPDALSLRDGLDDEPERSSQPARSPLAHGGEHDGGADGGDGDVAPWTTTASPGDDAGAAIDRAASHGEPLPSDVGAATDGAAEPARGSDARATAQLRLAGERAKGGADAGSRAAGSGCEDDTCAAASGGGKARPDS